jgi:3-methyl-2-oxobutanoate hydroxymethyltransferase
VLECIPAKLGAEISTELAIPTIGIGAGAGCDGQILVCYDMLGMTPGKRPKFSQDFLAGAGSAAEAIARYAGAVRDGSFPTVAQSF